MCRKDGATSNPENSAYSALVLVRKNKFGYFLNSPCIHKNVRTCSNDDRRHFYKNFKRNCNDFINFFQILILVLITIAKLLLLQT